MNIGMGNWTLIETDRVDWTAETLEHCIVETERLVARLEGFGSELDLACLRTYLREGLERQRELLRALRDGGPDLDDRSAAGPGRSPPRRLERTALRGTAGARWRR